MNTTSTSHRQQARIGLFLVLSVVVSALITVALPTQDVKAEPAARSNPGYSTPPINPFDARGYCFYSGCPTLYLGAEISALTTTPTWPMQGQVPTYIPFIYIGIDNHGYSNWWQANAFLVSSNGVRVPLGKGESDDGNKLESINIRCEPQYKLNPCSPSISWFQPVIPVTTPVGQYALEVQFYLSDGRLDAVYTFGPNFMFVTNQVLPESLNGKRCTNPGGFTNKDGVRYVCVKRKKGTVWKQI